MTNSSQECHSAVCDVLGTSKKCEFDENNLSASFRGCIDCFVKVSRIKKEIIRSFGPNNDFLSTTQSALEQIQSQLVNILDAKEIVFL